MKRTHANNLRFIGAIFFFIALLFSRFLDKSSIGFIIYLEGNGEEMDINSKNKPKYLFIR
jgi:hypothetical protein